MRTFKDKNNYPVHLSSIQGRDAFEGMIEGTPSLVRKMRLHRANEEMQKEGVFYWGIDQIEKELKDIPKDDLAWPPQEHWQALVGTSNYLGNFGDIYRYEKKQLIIHWYAEGGDPMQFLGDIIQCIDFLSLCKTILEDSYD